MMGLELLLFVMLDVEDIDDVVVNGEAESGATSVSGVDEDDGVGEGGGGGGDTSVGMV
jgi:hypothetical protein